MLLPWELVVWLSLGIKQPLSRLLFSFLCWVWTETGDNGSLSLTSKIQAPEGSKMRAAFQMLGIRDFGGVRGEGI